MSARDFNVLAAIHGLQDRGFIIVSPVEQRAGYRILAPGELDAETVEQCAKLIENGYDKPVGKPWRKDGKPSKNDECPHGRYMYEDCEPCAVIALRALAGSKDKEGRRE